MLRRAVRRLAVIVSTVKSAALTVGGQALAAGIISAKVAALTQGVMKAMLLAKLKNGVGILLALMLLGGVTAWVGTTYADRAAEQTAPRARTGAPGPRVNRPSAMSHGPFLSKWLKVPSKGTCRRRLPSLAAKIVIISPSLSRTGTLDFELVLKNVSDQPVRVATLFGRFWSGGREDFGDGSGRYAKSGVVYLSDIMQVQLTHFLGRKPYE